jgi:hypothetical protein
MLIVMAVVVYYVGVKVIISIVFMIIASITFIDAPNISDMTAVFIFVLGFELIKSCKSAIIIYSLNIVLIAFRASYRGMTIYQAFVLLVGMSVMYALYYFIIYKDSDRKSSVKFKSLTKEENKILSFIANGMSQKEAGFELGYDKYKTNYIVKEIRKKTGYDSLYEILYRAGLNVHSTSGHNK